MKPRRDFAQSRPELTHKRARCRFKFRRMESPINITEKHHYIRELEVALPNRRYRKYGPYHSKDMEGNCEKATFFHTTSAVSLEEKIRATPTTAVDKKNTDRSISRGRMAIADLRRVNLRPDTDQYYPTVVPSICDIARLIVSLMGTYTGLPLKVTKRDVASAFRLLRLRHALSLVMVTEFPATQLHLDYDMACLYLVMAIGRNGSPARLGRCGDAITPARMKCGVIPPAATIMIRSVRSLLYVGDGIFVEANVPGRLFATTQ